MAMVKVITRFVSGYCLHLVGVFAEMYSCIFSLRAHLVVAGVGVDLASIQFSCSVATAIFCTASSGESVVFEQRMLEDDGLVSRLRLWFLRRPGIRCRSKSLCRGDLAGTSYSVGPRLGIRLGGGAW